MYSDRRHADGDAIRFCVNIDGMTADFDTAVAQAIGEVLLIEPIIAPIDPLQPPEPLDYRMVVSEETLYYDLIERCSAFMGMTLAASAYPEWMTITRPYFTSQTVLAVTDPAYASFDDLPLDRPIGSRMLSGSDNQLLLYLQSLRESQRLKRNPYRNNQILLDRLLDGTVSAALIWEPALARGTGGDPASKGIRILDDLPFDPARTEIGIALRVQDTFLSNSLSQAIEVLVEDGTIDRLLVENGLAFDPPQAQ